MKLFLSEDFLLQTETAKALYREYFRRILCNLLGKDVERGELPDDLELPGSMVRDICHYNAERYFGF
jgi:glucuronate isomerase